MNLVLSLALAGLAACALSPARAESTYEASFVLDEMPRLRTGIPAYDTPDMLDGQWAPTKQFDTLVNSREVVDTIVDPDTGVETPVWGNYVNSANHDVSSGAPLSFGTSHAAISGPGEWSQTTGESTVFGRLLGTEITVRDVPAEAQGHATWNRDFWLEAGTTITFAGLATLAISGDAPGLDAAASFTGGDGSSFASFVYGDALGRARVEVGATLSNLASGLTGVFDHTVGPDGRVSLTITNTGTERLFGNLSAGAFVDNVGSPVAAPVPEPATWLMLLGGAALVGGVARRRAPARAPEPALA